MKTRVLHDQFRCAASTAQQAGQHGACPSRPMLPRSRGSMLIGAYGMLDAIEALPRHIALVRLGYEREPPLARLSAGALARLPVYVLSAMLGLTVRVGAAVDRVG